MWHSTTPRSVARSERVARSTRTKATIGDNSHKSAHQFPNAAPGQAGLAVGADERAADEEDGQRGSRLAHVGAQLKDVGRRWQFEVDVMEEEWEEIQVRERRKANIGCL
jgi:hypothetical protein